MKIVFISDTHGRWKKIKIPPCDLLISTGDYSFVGEINLIQDFHAWLKQQPAKHIISLQGNHETWVESNFDVAKAIAEGHCSGVHFLAEGLVEIEGLKIWGSAVTPYFRDWAWNRHPGEDIQAHWDKIPTDTDVLITHGPPYGILDKVIGRFDHLGCPQLAKKIEEIKPKIHAFGHIHSGHGTLEQNGTIFVNSAICDEEYAPNYQPIVVELK